MSSRTGLQSEKRRGFLRRALEFTTGVTAWAATHGSILVVGSYITYLRLGAAQRRSWAERAENYWHPDNALDLNALEGVTAERFTDTTFENKEILAADPELQALMLSTDTKGYMLKASGHPDRKGDVFFSVTEPDPGVTHRGDYLYVHGATECSELSINKIRQLQEQGYRVITVDMADHGRSYRNNHPLTGAPRSPLDDDIKLETEDYNDYVLSVRDVIAYLKNDSDFELGPLRIGAHSTGCSAVSLLEARLAMNPDIDVREHFTSVDYWSGHFGAKYPLPEALVGDAEVHIREVDAFLASYIDRVYPDLVEDRPPYRHRSDKDLQKDIDNAGAPEMVHFKRRLLTLEPRIDAGSAGEFMVRSTADYGQLIHYNPSGNVDTPDSPFAKYLARSGVPKRFHVAREDNVVSNEKTFSLISMLSQLGATVDWRYTGSGGYVTGQKHADFHEPEAEVEFTRFATATIDGSGMRMIPGPGVR